MDNYIRRWYANIVDLVRSTAQSRSRDFESDLCFVTQPTIPVGAGTISTTYILKTFIYCDRIAEILGKLLDNR